VKLFIRIKRIGLQGFIVPRRGGEGMTIEVATLFTGVAILAGACIAGGIIYAGLQKVADALNKQK
jgi:hypothetical protein